MLDFDAFARAAQRTARWSMGLLNDDGFAGAQGAVLGLYKAPVALLAAGHSRHAACAMDVAARFFHRDGDFHARAGDPTPPQARSYRNAWLAWGAHALGAFHLSGPAFARLERGLHPQFHGAADDDTVEPAKRLYPAGTAAQVANALLAGGRLEPALRIGAFLNTGDAGFLDSAEHIHGWLMRADESLYTNVVNGKVAWGAAEMHGVTGLAHWRDLALRIGQWLLEQQGEDGIWVRRPQFATSAEQPTAVSLDTSLERMFYMVDIPRALALRT
jgi:hypothetical protein